MESSFRQKIDEKTVTLNNTFRPDRLNIFRAFHPKTIYTHISAHGKISKIDQHVKPQNNLNKI